MGRLDLAPGAGAAIRDVVVLGRSGEGPGRLDGELRATLDGRPLLLEAIRIEPCAAREHMALPPDEPALAGPGAVRRASGAELPPVEAALAETWARWCQPLSIGTPTRLPHSVHEPS